MLYMYIIVIFSVRVVESAKSSARSLRARYVCVCVCFVCFDWF